MGGAGHTNDGEPDQAALEKGIGSAIRAARLHAGISMTNLAERCGLSQPHLSQLESGKTLPSINTLYKLANALDVSPQALLATHPDDVVVVRAGTGMTRPIEERANAALARVLHASPDRLLQIQEVSVTAEQDLGGFFDHEGEEFIYVLEGSIVAEVGTRAPTSLSPGDTIWYPATLPHRWTRSGEAAARMLVVSATVPGRRPHS